MSEAGSSVNAHEEGRQLGLSQAAALLRGEAQRLRASQYLTLAQRQSLVGRLQRLASAVEKLK